MEWRIVPGFENYEISDLGQIRSKRGVLKPFLNPDGYPQVDLGGNRRTIHRLVALVFLGEKPAPNLVVNHKDGVKTNNSVANLEYVTHSEDVLHAWRLGLQPPTRNRTTPRAPKYPKKRG